MIKETTKMSTILSIVSLLADVIALSQLTFSIVIQKETNNIPIRIIIIVLVFLLGLGLGYIGLRGSEKMLLEKVLVIYTWAYLIVACLSYLGVVIQLRGDYSPNTYFSFWIILIIQIAAFSVLLLITKPATYVPYSFAILTLAVLHALIFLYYFIFNDIPSTSKVISELIIWFGWTLYAAFIVQKSFKFYGKRNRFKR